MRKGPAFAFMATALVLLLFLSALRNRPKDPTFEGKLASEWCRELLGEDFEDEPRFASPGAPRAAWIGLDVSF